MPFTIAQKIYLGANPAKHVQDFYAEKCKMLIKEIKDLNRWGDILAHELENSI